MPVSLATANITLDTATVSRQGFATIMFIGKHNYFSERVRTYTSVSAMVEDGIPTTSGVYQAALAAFSQENSPSYFKIGRQESTSIFTPVTPTNSLEYKITISAKDAVSAEFVYVATVPTDDEETVVDALKAAIDADTDIAAAITTTKVGTGSSATLQISQTVAGTDWFVASSLQNIEESFVAVSGETPADTLEAIVAEDNEFYYITAEDHSTAFITGLAAAVEAKSKFYRFSTSDVGSYANPVTGAIAAVQTSNYDRTNGFYHHDADTIFPEVAALAEIASYITGSVTYSNRTVSAVSTSLNADGRPLTATQQLNLQGVNGSFFARVGTFVSDPVITVGGLTASGEKIENIVARDNMQVDFQADITNWLIRRTANKAQFNNKGANELRNVVQQVLTDYSTDGTHNFIEPDFEIYIPDQADFNAADKALGTFRQITFKATLTDAIIMVEISGTLSI